MMYHITINGRPLCEHTACQAGIEDLRKVIGRPTCGQGDIRGADRAARDWAAVHPHHRVAIAIGVCEAAMAEEV